MNFYTIDPGHGPGYGVQEGLTTEEEFCYQLAERTVMKLSMDLPFRFDLSRTEKEATPNSTRAKNAKRNGSRLTLSIHSNAGPINYHGAHAFYREGSKAGKAIAEAIMRAWPKELSRSTLYGRWSLKGWIEGAVAIPREGFWPRVHNVFEAYKAEHQEIVLVETHYKTNYQEELFAHSESAKEEMAMALARGLLVADRLLQNSV